MPQHETSNETVRVALLEAELRHARDILAEKATLLAAKEEQIQDLRNSLRLLEAPRQAAPDPAPKQSIWTRPIRLWPSK
jgi:hypothetical protein